MMRFTRLVFSVNCTLEIFQRTLERKLSGIDGVIVYIDDILIHAESERELQERTDRVLESLRRNNLTLNEGKCEYANAEIKFLGHCLSKKGSSFIWWNAVL
jgi:Reverse transcriptase (RNA-dependent DNA polymerase)